MQITKCLICYSSIPDWSWDKTSSPERDVISNHVEVIFVLRHLLQIPSSLCEKYLLEAGNPEDWVRTCSKCTLIVQEAFFINSQINSLRRKLDTASRAVREEVKKSFLKDATTSTSKGSQLNVTKETREYVAHCKKSEAGCPVAGTSSKDLPENERTGEIPIHYGQYEEANDTFTITSVVTIKDEVDEDGLISGDFYDESLQDLIVPETEEYVETSDEQPSFQRRKQGTEGIIECPICQEKFASEYDFIDHRRDSHEDLRKKANASGECEFCGKKYRLQNSLRAHRIAAHNARYHFTKKLRNKLGSPATPAITTRNSERSSSNSNFGNGDDGSNLEYDGDTSSANRVSTSRTRTSLKNPNDEASDNEWLPGDEPKASTSRRIVKSKKPLECLICKEVFLTMFEFVKHRRENHEDLRLKANASGECEFCGKKYRLQNSLRVHRISAHNVRYHLPNCSSKNKRPRKSTRNVEISKSLSDAGNIDNDINHANVDPGFNLTHLETASVKSEIELIDEASNPRTSARISFKKNMNRSARTSDMDAEEFNGSEKSVATEASGDEWVPEFESIKKVPSITRKKTRKRKNHFKSIDKESETGDPENSADLFQCEECPDKFKTESSLQIHLLRRHKIIRRFKCTLCPHVSKQRAHLRIHMQKHSGARPHVCEICNRTFTHKNYLRWHKIREHDDKSAPNPFACDICKKVFASVYSLKHHRNSIHENVFKVACEVCGAGFQAEKALEIHMRAHTKERPCKCTYDGCSAAFSQVNSLKRHIRAQHTGEKPYKCSHCDKQFSGWKNRKQHEDAIHSTHRPFVCEICGKTFAIRPYLFSHMKSHGDKSSKIKPKESSTLDYQVSSINNDLSSSVIPDNVKLPDLPEISAGELVQTYMNNLLSQETNAIIQSQSIAD